MAPSLRSTPRATPRARSSQSGPATPLHATAAVNSAASFSESTRPRKQRRTGRHSRVATDPLQDTEPYTPSQHETGVNDTASDSHARRDDRDWLEPPLRTPAPSWEDTPWSLVSSEHNPVLSTMRPLGTMPTPADLRKVGLVPAKPSAQNIPAKNGPESLSLPNGAEDKPQTPLTPTEEQSGTDLPPKSVADLADFNLGAFMTLPLPSATDGEVDVVKLRTAVGNALHMASESENRAVVRGLLRLWGNCDKDPFSLSILDSICQETPGPREKSAFQSMMRAAWREVQTEDDPELAPTAVPALGRASSVSSLSSAKSLDDPGPAASAATSRARARGKHARAAAEKPAEKEARARHSIFPSNDTIIERKRVLQDDPEFSQAAVSAKRTRLRRSLPRLAPPMSSLRSSLAAGARARSGLSTPIPAPEPHDVDGRSDMRRERERSESVASSDAADNRRLTPTVDTDKEDGENNDFCRECNGSGQLLCCDGCIDSYHFSCLDPPLDPANPPEGDWYCPRCSVRRPMRSLLDRIDTATAQEDFALPLRFRDHFAGVKTGDGGKYDDVIPFAKLNPRSGRGKTGRYDDPYLLRIHDAKGKLIFCQRCGQTSNGVRPIIQCDFCPCAFHMDCCDPPLAIPPVQRPNSDKPHQNWMCNNHIHHDLYQMVKDEDGYDCTKRIRRPKRPRLIDVEVLPDEEESEKIEDKVEEGILYRVSEKGLELDFINRVKRENDEVAIKKMAADRFLDYAKTEHDRLAAQAHAFYASQKPAVPEEDTTVAILNSRSVAEREAASNLIAFAQSHEISKRVENGKITLLIDQLRASAPNNLPPPDTEIASLRTLQELIEQRIQVLNAQAAALPAPSAAEFSATRVQSVETEPEGGTTGSEVQARPGDDAVSTDHVPV